MSFRCPECGNGGSLEITLSIQLPPDNRSDDISFQVVECSLCGFGGLAVYEASRRGSINNEAWNHTGYRVDGDVVHRVKQMMVFCPDPGNAMCDCLAHVKINQRDPQNQWNWLSQVEIKESFRMDLKR